MKLPPDVLREAVASQIACVTADDSLRRSMQEAEKLFTEFVLARSSFPRSKREALIACADLQQLADKNPYAKQPLLVRHALSQLPDTAAHAFVGFDPSISQNKVRYWKQFPPEEWTAPPGSIAIMHNGKDRFVVWATGIDSKPLRDQAGLVYMLSTRVDLPYR